VRVEVPEASAGVEPDADATVEMELDDDHAEDESELIGSALR
jgi:hypothetical protein